MSSDNGCPKGGSITASYLGKVGVCVGGGEHIRVRGCLLFYNCEFQPSGFPPVFVSQRVVVHKFLFSERS